MDADVIKTYVQLGMGVGIVAGVAYEAERDTQRRASMRGGRFGINLTKARGAARHLPAQVPSARLHRVLRADPHARGGGKGAGPTKPGASHYEI